MSEDVPPRPDQREREFALKERETIVKEADVRLRGRQAAWYSNPIVVALIGATAVLCATILTTWKQGEIAMQQAQRQGASAMQQAHAKAQSDLVVEAIKTGDPQRAAKNLLFLVRLGLLDDPGGKMQAALSHPEDVPYLPSPQPRSGYGEGGYGVGPYGGAQAPKGRRQGSGGYGGQPYGGPNP